MALTAKNVALNVLYYAVTVGGLPWVALYLEHRLGFRQFPMPVLRFPAVVLGLAAGGLQLWCIVVFQRIGKGTPSPLWPPSRLVMAGPYRRLRNPMNVGEVLLLSAMAVWFGSPTLLGYTLMAWLSFHIFVVYYEEPRLTRRFGDRYEVYCRTAGRWVPKVSNAGSRKSSTAA